MITIGCGKFFAQVCALIMNLGLMSFFTYSFIILPGDLMNNSKLLGVYIIISWITVIPNFRVLFLIISNYGTSMDENVWKNLIANGKLINLCTLIGFCIGTYYMFIIGPFFGSCSIYSGQLACISVQIIAFLSFLGWCAFGFVILYFVIVIVAYVIANGEVQNRAILPSNFNINHEPNRDSIFQRNDPVLVSATQFLEKYNIIPDPEPLSKCAICQETVEENSERWIRLACGHIGHGICLAEWFKHEQSCPYCRAHISISDPVEV
jgi:hypothetical protein